jgi:photosystem II stability/assembly factor-like uncharacterized protein
VKVLTDRPLPEIGAPAITGPGDDAEALFREARRRRRIRRAWVAGVTALALAAAGTAYGVLAHSPNGPPTGSTAQLAPAKTTSAPPKGNAGADLAAGYSNVQVLGMADPHVAWTASPTGIYVTTDQGRQWRDVTPPNLSHQDVAERIEALDAIGTDDLWLVLADVPGLVPYADSTDGSDRGEGIDRSTDGGQTWTFTALPGCLQACGANLTVSFVDPEHGFTTNGPGQGTGPTLLFTTSDGGITWTKAGDLPDLGSISADGPGPGAQMEFINTLDGWAVTGPSGYSSSGAPTARGGVLYRTTNGGASWVRASGLPQSDQFALPTFFGSQVGVVLANPQGASGPSSPVFVTDDGGETWTVRSTPRIAGMANFKPRGLNFRFDAIGPATWKIDVGSKILTTTNAGRSWTSVTPKPKGGGGSATAVVFSSTHDGLSISEPPGCSNAPNTPASEECFPALTATTDGGTRWIPVTP